MKLKEGKAIKSFWRRKQSQHRRFPPFSTSKCFCFDFSFKNAFLGQLFKEWQNSTYFWANLLYLCYFCLFLILFFCRFSFDDFAHPPFRPHWATVLTILIRMMRSEDEFVFAPQTGNRAWGLPVVKGGEEQGMGKPENGKRCENMFSQNFCFLRSFWFLHQYQVCTPSWESRV